MGGTSRAVQLSWLHISNAEVRGQSPVKELRSHMPRGEANNNKNRTS